MTNTPFTTTQSQLIAVAKLAKSPLNARHTIRTDGIGELKASILSHGLMQNLVVTASDDGTYQVIAGSRRLQAIQLLQAEEKLPPDFAVSCQVVTEEHALEMSLAENTIRLAMHPADQFQAFAELIDKGANAADVAQRFGVEESLVHKRMKLARVAPELLEEYRNDGMTLECLMAYTITDDHRRQRKVFKSLQDWQKDDPSVIRDALTEKMVDAKSKLARFVGIEAYSAAGGSIRADLFGEDVYLEKPALLNKLAEKKFDAIRLELEAEGWNWVEINPERDWNLINRCSRIKPILIDAPAELIALKSGLDTEMEEIERALDDTESDELLEKQQTVHERLDQAEEQLVAFVGFDAGQKQLAGCVVSIGQDGTPFIEKGLVRPEQRKQLAKLLKAEDGDNKPERTKPKSALSEALRKDLAASRLRVAQVEVAKHPLLAFDLLVFQVAQALLDKPSGHEAAGVHFGRPRQIGWVGMDMASADAALDGVAKSLSLDWLKPESESARFDLFRVMPESSKLEILAYCVATTLKPRLAPGQGDECTAYDITLSLTGASVTDYWRPTTENFLGRITRTQLLRISGEVFGDAWAQAHSDAKKATLVDRLHHAFSNPDASGQSQDHLAKLMSWLPEGMAFGILETMKPVTTKKLKKAA